MWGWDQKHKTFRVAWASDGQNYVFGESNHIALPLFNKRVKGRNQNVEKERNKHSLPPSMRSFVWRRNQGAEHACCLHRIIQLSYGQGMAEIPCAWGGIFMHFQG
jgi:hypothetical protein